MTTSRKRPLDDDTPSPGTWLNRQGGTKKSRVMMTQEQPETEGDTSEFDSEEEDSDEEEEIDTTPAKAGVIEKITLKNFMCHDSFELVLGPQINFIIGRNGSGKSAVLTGISAALGAKATTTNRGNSIKDLIKDGKSTARVSVLFWNEGPEAYQPEIYGDRIIIERKLQRVGAHSYYIKSAQGKIISTKKVVLDEILYKFVITVDNPLAFLSQDRAREFLTTSTDNSKYEYFMKGAHINDIVGNYEATAKNIVEIKKRVDDAEKQNTALNAKYHESKSTYDLYRASDSLREKLEVIHGKIYWFNVNIMESKIGAYEKKSREAQFTLDEITKELENKLLEEQAYKEQRVVLETQAEVKTNEILDLQKLYDDSFEKVAKLQGGIKETRDEIVSRNAEIERLDKDIITEQKQIEEENRRIDQINGESKDELKKSLIELNNKVVELTENRAAEKVKERDLDGEIPGLASCNSQHNAALRTKEELVQKKSKLRDSQSNKYAAFGPEMHRIVNSIKQTTTWHKSPIGPLGSLVLVKPEYTQWKQLLGTILAKTLNAFLVCDGHDRAILQGILNQYRAHKSSIIVRKFETFNFNHAKPQGEITFVDMLLVESEHALYTLVDSNGIEQLITAHNQVEASQKIRKNNVRSAFFLFGARSGSSLSLNGNVERLDPIHFENDLSKFSTASGSITTELEETDRRIAKLDVDINILKRQKRVLESTRSNQKSACQINLKSITKELERTNKEIREVENKLNQDGDFEKIESLQTQIKENQMQIEILRGVVTSLQEDVVERKSELAVLRQELRDAKNALDTAANSFQKVKQAIISIDTELAAIETNKTHFGNERARNEAILEETNQNIKLGLEKLREVVEKAESKCERLSVTIGTDDTLASIAEEYREIQNQVKDADSRVGLPLAEVQAQLERAFAKKEAAQATLDSLSQLYREMDSELNGRYTYLHTTINVNIQNASRTFENALELRGFKGSLQFDHKAKELKLMAKTRSDDEKRTMDSLSGGEKSFAQIALLLSIWRVMDSRIRGLDEFDVFMDSVNRSISIKLLLTELRQYPRSQSIFITPQDIAVVGDLEGTDYKIHKMRAPRED